MNTEEGRNLEQEIIIAEKEHYQKRIKILKRENDRLEVLAQLSGLALFVGVVLGLLFAMIISLT